MAAQDRLTATLTRAETPSRPTPQHTGHRCCASRACRSPTGHTRSSPTSAFATRPRREPRAHRRVGLGQVDDRPLGAAAAAARHGQAPPAGSSSTATRSWRCPKRRFRPLRGRDDRVRAAGPRRTRSTRCGRSARRRRRRQRCSTASTGRAASELILDDVRPGRARRPAARLRLVPAPAVRRHAAARADRTRGAARGRRSLVADEPTSALDVTIQKRILDLLSRAAARARTSACC